MLVRGLNDPLAKKQDRKKQCCFVKPGDDGEQYAGAEGMA